MSSSASKGGNWTNTLVFIEYNEDGRSKKELNKEQLLPYFMKLKTNEEEILKAQIWKHPLGRFFPALFGDWHEYTVVESTNWLWSFEKQMDAIYVQRSRKARNDALANVKEKLDGENRSARIMPEGRSNNNVGHKENIHNIIEWILNRGELNNTYHITQSNCHFFASLLYEAIVRDKGRRLDNTN